MPDTRPKSPIEQIKSHFERFDRQVPRWQVLQQWLMDADRALSSVDSNRNKPSSRGASSRKKLSLELESQFDDMSFGWTNCPFGADLFMMTVIARHMPQLAGIMWELIRTELHGEYLVTQVTPPSYEQWYAHHSLPMLWELLKMELYDKNWIDLNDNASRAQSTELLTVFIKNQLAIHGLTIGMRRVVDTMIKECESLKRTPKIAKFTADLQAATVGVETSSTEWLDYCRRAVCPGEKNPTDELFPVAPGLTAIVIDKGEQKLMDAAIKDAVACRKKYRNSAIVKSWLEHIKSPKCLETPGRLIVHLMMQAWIVDAYQRATGLVLQNYGGKANAKLADLLSQGLYPTIEEMLRRKVDFEPDEFDAFVRLLPRIWRSYGLLVPTISRIEEFAARHTITEPQRQLIHQFFDPKYLDSTQGLTASKRWQTLDAKLKRRAPRKANSQRK